MELNFKKYGSGPNLIILHGLFGSLDNWHTVAGKLGETFTVYAIDQRNHGRSPHTDDMGYALMAEDLTSFMDDHGIDSAHVIGHSMGGKTAMKFALEYGSKVEKLIVVDMTAARYEGAHQEIIDAMNSLDFSKVNQRSDADDQLKNHIPEKSIRQFLLKNLTRGDNGKYTWKMNLRAIEDNYEKILDAIESEHIFEGDTLFIKGGQSNYIDKDRFDQCRNIFPKAKLVNLKRVGHWVHAEAPDAFIKTVKTFLQRKEHG